MNFYGDESMLKTDALVVAAGIAVMSILAISHKAFCIVLVRSC